jgi:transposase
MKIDSFEQRWAVKFCTKLNKKAAETHELLKQAYGEYALSYVQVTRWVKKFKEGQEGVEDDPRSGRPSTSQTDENVTRVRYLLNTDCPDVSRH